MSPNLTNMLPIHNPYFNKFKLFNAKSINGLNLVNNGEENYSPVIKVKVAHSIALSYINVKCATFNGFRTFNMTYST